MVAVRELMAQARDVIMMRRVVGAAIEPDGVAIVPLVNVAGGGGGWSGAASNGGFGILPAPAGVFVMRGKEVAWPPALNLNWVILGRQLVAIVLFLAIRAIVRALVADRPGR